MKYKFLDVGCKIGGSFNISEKFGYKREDGIVIDINKQHVDNFINSEYNSVVADANNLKFEDNSFLIKK